MDNFQNFNEERDSDLVSDSSEGNDLLFQFIFGEKESTANNHKGDRNEYRIRVDTDLKDPADKRRANLKQRRQDKKRKKPFSQMRKPFCSSIKGRPPKRLQSPSESLDQGSNQNRQLKCVVLGCEKIFTDSSSFRKHMITHGERQGEKPYVCELCNKKFSLDFNLKTHLRTHTGEKPYLCTFPSCNKRFTQSSNLTAHEKTHCNPREYDSLCGDQDGNGSQLRYPNCKFKQYRADQCGLVGPNGEFIPNSQSSRENQEINNCYIGQKQNQFCFLITFKPRSNCKVHEKVLQKMREHELRFSNESNDTEHSLHEYILPIDNQQSLNTYLSKQRSAQNMSLQIQNNENIPPQQKINSVTEQGGGSKANMEDEFGQSSSNAADNSGPIEDRLLSKNWSVRAQAYDEMNNMFKGSSGPNDQVFREYSNDWKKYLSDSNPGALEKCLDALETFINRADPKIVGCIQNEVIKILIEKCIGHAKPTIKQKSLELFNLLFEVSEQFDESVDTMTECLNSKNIKVSICAVTCLASWTGNYGVKKVKIKSFLPFAETAASAINPQMRQEVMNFYVQCYKWLGEGLKPLLEKLKKQQLDDLEKQFLEIKDKPKNQRLTRTDQKNAKEAQLDQLLAKESEESKAEDVAFEFAQPVDVLAKYGPEWQDKVLEFKKWNEKKEALDDFITFCSVPKIKPGDFSGIIAMIKKLLTDSNAAVTHTSVKALVPLAKGLRQSFESQVKELVAPLLQKFKEKRAGFSDDIHLALDSFLQCTSIETFLFDIVAGLQDKAPAVKKNVCVFIEKSAQKTYIDVLQRCSNDILPPLTKLSEDTSGEIRDAALVALGILKGRLGEGPMSKFLSDLNPQKLNKLNEAAATVQPSKYDRPEKQEKKPAAAGPTKGAPPKKAPVKKQPSTKEETKMEEDPTPPAKVTKAPSNTFDDQPIKKTAANTFDDQPIRKAANLDDQPIGGGASQMLMEGDEDRPIPKGAYNLDNLEELERQMMASAKPRKGPLPAQKAKIEKQVEEEKKAPIDVEMQDEEEVIPVKAPPPKIAPKAAPPKAPPVNIDEKPLGGGAPKIENEGGEEDKPLPKGAYNLDNLEELERQMMASAKPKNPPPMKMKIKEEQKASAEDVDMQEDEVQTKAPPKAAPKKEPPKSAAPAKAQTAAATSGKGPAAPQIKEEDIGQGLSKEEAEAKVAEVFSAEFVAKMEEAKWQDKVEGLKGFGEQIAEIQPDSIAIEALARFVKTKMKDWKESNINLIKEAILLFTTVSNNSDKVSKRTAFILMPFLADKIGDVKTVNIVSELLLLLSAQVTPKYIALQVMKYGAQAKSPNTLKESCNILTTMSDEFGITSLPLKEMIEFATLQANHQNIQVRTSAFQLFSMMFKHVGEPIKNFLKDIKESTMKLIEEEFAKTTPYKKGEFQPKREFKGQAAAELAPATTGKGGKAAAGGGGGLDDMLPREDISKHLNAKLMPMFKNNDWKIRKEAADKVEEMMRAANMRIKPDGLNELMDNIKQRMADPNKAVLKAYVQLICLIVQALGANSKQFSKKLLPPMLQNLADKQTLVRQDVVTAMDRWAQEVGAEVVINFLGPMIVQENPELRNEALTWIIKNKESIKLTEIKELVKPLVACLNDKVPGIRNLTELVAIDVMTITGFQPFQQALLDLKPAVQNTIKPILEKVKQKCGPLPTQAAQESLNASGPPRPQTAAPATNKKPADNDSNNGSLGGNKAPLKGPGSGIPAPKEQTAQRQTQPQGALGDSIKRPTTAAGPQRSASKDGARKIGAAPVQQKVAEFTEVEGLTIVQGHKKKRADQDAKNKWQHDTDIKSDQVDRLKQFCQQIFGQTIYGKMFSNDFKLHCDCLEYFTALISTSPDQIKEILDLIFKWCFVKLSESSNTKFAITVFDYFHSVITFLENDGYQLWDFEAAVLIPLLCEKTGFNNNIIKDKVKKLIRQSFNIYDRQKTYNFLVQYGINSKNLRAVAECLDEVGEFMKIYGVDFTSEKELKTMAKMADNADKSIRENAVKALSEVYKYLDEDIWRAIGEVTPKVKGILEQRFKNQKKQMQPSASTSAFFKPSDLTESVTTATSGFVKKPSIVEKKGLQTPRQGGLQFKSPALNQSAMPAQQQLSKSINKFNNSLQESEKKGTPSSTLQKRAEFMKKTQSSDNTIAAASIGQRLMPQTQRAGPSDFTRGTDQLKMQSKFDTNKNTQIFNDDDDELRNLANEVQGDPELERQQTEITQHIHQLKYGDLSRRVDSLVSLNEMISSIEQNRTALVRTSNDLINAFTHVLIDIFERPVEDIPLRFAKYFITIVHKVCSCKEIMKEVSEERIQELAEQLLTRLLIENLDKVGENGEGELILKNLNSSMLRLLENCNHTYIFCVLFNLLRKYKDFNILPKLPGLIIKCLLKLSKILEKLIDRLDMEKILLAIHEYLVVVNHDNKTQNDEMGIRIVKTVTNELVKLKRESIWEAYRVIQCHDQADNHIYRWIQIILKSLQSQGGSAGSSGLASVSTSGYNEGEIRSIVEELRNSEQFEQAIPKLQKFLEMNPQVDLNEHLSDCSKTFQSFIKQNLEKYKNNMKDDMDIKTPDLFMSKMKSSQPEQNLKIDLNSANVQQPQSTQGTDKITQYQSKLSNLQSRFSQRPGGSTTTAAAATSGQQANMNSSFSKMNSSLSQRWNQLKKPETNMTHTMGPTATPQGLKPNENKNQMNSSSGPMQDQPNPTGATNQDLNKRLAEMKAKLQALKKN